MIEQASTQHFEQYPRSEIKKQVGISFPLSKIQRDDQTKYYIDNFECFYELRIIDVSIYIHARVISCSLE